MRHAKPRRDRLTVEVEPELRSELERWAAQEQRPMGNLIRRVLSTVVSERRLEQERAHAA